VEMLNVVKKYSYGRVLSLIQENEKKNLQLLCQVYVCLQKVGEMLEYIGQKTQLEQQIVQPIMSPFN
jgi:hypothetical protein